MQNDLWSHDGEWTMPPPFLSAQRVRLPVNCCANQIGKEVTTRTAKVIFSLSLSTGRVIAAKLPKIS